MSDPNNPYPFLNKVGVEMEGGWRNRVFSDVDIHEDISVPQPEGYAGEPYWHFGEVASPPLPPAEAGAWLLKHYPLDIPEPRDGKSCGMHFHLSTHSEGDYNKLLSKTFYDYFLKGITNLSIHCPIGLEDALAFQERLAGRNRFARRLYAPSRQVWCEEKDSGRDAERRTLINYCHGLHGTLEFRLFPMFTSPKVCVEALKLTMSLTNSFLAERAGKHDRAEVRKTWVGDLLEGCL